MIHSTTNQLFEHRGLYAPDKPHSPSEHIPSSYYVCVLRVAAGYASKLLSYSAFLRHHPAEGTCTGSVGRRHEQKTNTVLLCFGFYPVEYLPVCPWCHSFSETFSFTFFLTCFQSLQIFHSKNMNIFPRKSVQIFINEVFPLPDSPQSPIRPWDSSSDLVSDSLELGSVEVPVRVRDEFIYSLVQSQALPCLFRFFAWAFDPDSYSTFREAAALDEFSVTGQPFINGLGLSGGNGQPMTLFQGRNSEYQVKGLFTGLDRDELRVEDGRAFKNGTGSRFTEFMSGTFCGYDYFQGLFESVGLIAFRESGRLESGQGRPIKFTRAGPEGLNEEVDCGPVGLKESGEGPFFPSGEEFESYFTGTLHNRKETKKDEYI